LSLLIDLISFTFFNSFIVREINNFVSILPFKMKLKSKSSIEDIVIYEQIFTEVFTAKYRLNSKVCRELKQVQKLLNLNKEQAILIENQVLNQLASSPSAKERSHRDGENQNEFNQLDFQDNNLLIFQQNYQEFDKDTGIESQNLVEISERVLLLKDRVGLNSGRNSQKSQIITELGVTGLFLFGLIASIVMAVSPQSNMAQIELRPSPNEIENQQQQERELLPQQEKESLPEAFEIETIAKN